MSSDLKGSPSPQLRGLSAKSRSSSLEASGAADAAPGGEPVPVLFTMDEINALLNTWPSKPGTAIIAHKPSKWEKRLLLPIGADWEVDGAIFQAEDRMFMDKLEFIHADGGRQGVKLPLGVGDWFYVDEPVEVVDRPDDAEWVRIRYMADDERKMILFEEHEPRPRLGLLRYKHLPLRYARSDRLRVRNLALQRLWDVTETQATAEGSPLINHQRGSYFHNATRRMGFEANWNQLHAPLHGFDKANWWTLVVTFAREFED